LVNPRFNQLFFDSDNYKPYQDYMGDNGLELEIPNLLLNFVTGLFPAQDRPQKERLQRKTNW
jgi:hypothetical protein